MGIEMASVQGWHEVMCVCVCVCDCHERVEMVSDKGL